MMSDFDVERLRANWNRARPAAVAPADPQGGKPEVAAQEHRQDAVALLDELRALVEEAHGQHHPILATLLAEARSCCGELTYGAGSVAEDAAAATRLLDLVTQLEDLLEVYGGMGMAR
jgi:hypothetical protein